MPWRYTRTRVRQEVLAESPKFVECKLPFESSGSAPPGARRGPHTGTRRWVLSTVQRETNPGDGEWQHA